MLAVGETIRRMFEGGAQLSTLNIAHNNLGSSGAMMIAKCIRSNGFLQHIDLRNNAIGDKGLAALADSLAASSGISSCLVWGNAFGSVSCTLYKEMLMQRNADSRPLLIDVKPYEVDGEIKVAWSPLH